MICSHLSELTGLSCYPLNDDGSVAMIATPFVFEDGDEVPVFVENIAGKVRFFDDGGVLMHFLGRGLKFDSKKKSRFIQSIAGSNGAAMNDDGEIEVWSSVADAGVGFAKYMSTILELVSWEKEQKDVNHDMALFIEEVAFCLMSWKKHSTLTRQPEYKGISGHLHKLDFALDGEAIVAIAPRARSVSAALRKMIDVTSSPANQDLTIKVILDDRKDPEGAKAESLVLGAVSDVLMMTRLEYLAHSPASIN